MRIKRVTDDEKDWFFEFYEDYSQLLQKCKWYAFRFAHIEVENDKLMGDFEATFILLGLGFRFRWNHTLTKERQECDEAIKKILEEEDGQN